MTYDSSHTKLQKD